MNSDAWIETYTGNVVYPLELREEDVHIEDIAHALSLICRFNGHCRCFYSVAQHSVLVSEIVIADFALAALLHDAAEAYIADVGRPVKHLLIGYDEIEERILRVIYQRSRSVWPNSEVKRADNIALATEARDLMPNVDGWYLPEAPLNQQILPWSAHLAEERFLLRYKVLSEGRA